MAQRMDGEARCLGRYLRLAGGDAGKATAALRVMLAWRAEVGVGFGRIAASETEAPVLFVNMVSGG
jgi:hypothetical protein